MVNASQGRSITACNMSPRTPDIELRAALTQLWRATRETQFGKRKIFLFKQIC
jgi:hypothetical protein